MTAGTRAVARSLEGLAHEVELEGGRTMTFDEPADAGGTDRGPAPAEMTGASLAACTAITVRMYADRKGWDAAGLEVAVDTAYDGPRPVAYTVELDIPDRFDEEQKKRLRHIATRCPVHRTLAEAMPIEVR